MSSIVAISGSLRRGSFNTALLRAARDLAPSNSSIEIASIFEFPLYNADLEKAEGIPDPVVRLKERLMSSKGLLVASPEYNSSLPGVLKNALDWLSRPPKDVKTVFGDLPVGVIGATTGAGGTRLCQAAWLPVLRALHVRIFTQRSLLVSKASEVFDENGALVDEKIRNLLTNYLLDFEAFTSTSTRGE